MKCGNTNGYMDCSTENSKTTGVGSLIQDGNCYTGSSI